MCIRRGNMCMRHDSIPNEYYEWRPSWASILTIQKGSLTADKWCIFNSQWLISRFVNTNYTVHVTMRAYIGVLIQSRDEAWFDRLSMCDWWQSLNLLSYKMNSEHIDISQNGDALFLTYSKPHQNLAFYTYLWQRKEDIPHKIHISILLTRCLSCHQVGVRVVIWILSSCIRTSPRNMLWPSCLVSHTVNHSVMLHRSSIEGALYWNIWGEGEVNKM